ncbi:diguanylate cyclase [Candidatus Poribacteria bacterium]|nr:diguanylate cyclase [Candidatus Poribacteria bacterium]
MLRRRRKNDSGLSENDSPSDLSKPSLIISKLKDITSMLLDAIRHSASDSEELNSETFKVDLDQNHFRLKKSFDVQELTEIKENLKKLLLNQHQAENIRHQSQYAEYSQIVETLVEGIGEFTGDNDDFNKRVDLGLSQIGRVAIELNDLKQIRQQIAQRVIQTKKVLQEKRQRDNEKQQMLTRKIAVLEVQLNKAQEEILIDDMTQLYNRRGFDRRIKEAVERRKMFEQDFALLMFDVDHFKNVNDAHGHQIGDRLLTALGQQVKLVFRLDDFVARYGGEEFAVIIYCSSIDIAQSAADRLRETIDSYGFRYIKDDKAQMLSITISAGVAWCGDDDTPESLIRRADECLYLAKRRGRNRVCVESGLESADVNDKSSISETAPVIARLLTDD